MTNERHHISERSVSVLQLERISFLKEKRNISVCPGFTCPLPKEKRIQNLKTYFGEYQSSTGPHQ